MKPLLLGFVGGLIALALGGAILGVVLVKRAEERSSPAARRAVLTKQINEYGLYLARGGFSGQSEFNLFLTQHPEFQQYWYWYAVKVDAQLAAFEQQNVGYKNAAPKVYAQMAANYRAQLQSAENLRDPANLDQYLAISK